MGIQDVMQASLLDFENVDHFGRSEFPADVLEYIESDLVLGLSDYRERLGHAVEPSAVVAGWYRAGGSEKSRHYIGQGKSSPVRLSDGGDVFPQCDIRDAFLVAMGCDWWGGIGVYFDTNGNDGKPQPMLHLDLRPGRVVWMRHEVRYIYPLRSESERKEFWKLLGEFDHG